MKILNNFVRIALVPQLTNPSKWSFDYKNCIKTEKIKIKLFIKYFKGFLKFYVVCIKYCIEQDSRKSSML